MIEVVTTIDIRVPKWDLSDGEAVELMKRIFPEKTTSISTDDLNIGFKSVTICVQGDYVISTFITQKFTDEKTWKVVNRYVEEAWRKLTDDYIEASKNIKTYMKYHDGGCTCTHQP